MTDIKKLAVATADADPSDCSDPAADPRTMPYRNFVGRLAKRMGDPVLDMLHAAVGMSGECAEFLGALLARDNANIIEELGDWDFYFHHFLLAVMDFLPDASWTYDELNEARLASFAQDIATYGEHGPLDNGWMWMVATGDLLDHVKKCWVYNRPVDHPLFMALAGRAMFYFCMILQERKLDRGAINEANRAKLLVRYEGGKYSDDAANARKDKIVQEMEVPGMARTDAGLIIPK